MSKLVISMNDPMPQCSGCATLRQRVKELESEKIEHDASFDLRWKADMRAIKQWQAAGEGRELIWPDHADLCVWLLNQLAAANERVRILREATIELGAALSNLLDNANWGFFGNTYDAMNATRYKGRAALEATKEGE